MTSSRHTKLQITIRSPRDKAETERVFLEYLRAVEPHDAQLLATPRNAAIFTEAVLWPGVVNHEPVFIACAKQDVVGATFSVVAAGFDYKQPHLFGHGTWVHPEWRRAGVARHLLAAVRQWMAINDIRLQIGMAHNANDASLATYAALGFKPYAAILRADV